MGGHNLSQLKLVQNGSLICPLCEDPPLEYASPCQKAS